MVLLGYAATTRSLPLAQQRELLRTVRTRDLYVERDLPEGAGHPELNKLVRRARRGDTVLVASLSVLGQSLSEVVHQARYLTSTGLMLRWRNDQIDSSSLTAGAVAAIFDELSRCDWELQLERVVALRAKRGPGTGAPRRLRSEEIYKVRADRRRGLDVASIVRRSGASPATIYRVLKLSEQDLAEIAATEAAAMTSSTKAATASNGARTSTGPQKS